MCWELYDHRDWLWTFLKIEGVEPTNNAAERSLRHAVIWRKLLFGTQGAGGSRFVETGAQNGKIETLTTVGSACSSDPKVEKQTGDCFG